VGAVTRRAWSARSAVVLAFATGVVLWPSSAQAHPFGEPLTATISSATAGDGVRVTWRPGAPDDFVFLAAGLGVSDSDPAGDIGLMAVKRDADLLAASPAFARYVVDNISVSDGSGRCRGELAPLEHLIGDGVTVDFTCPHLTGAVDLSVTMMTDLHPAYRTLTTGPRGQRFVYGVDQPGHRWDLTGSATSSDPARSAAVQLGSVAGVLAALGAGVVWWRRGRSRSSRATRSV